MQSRDNAFVTVEKVTGFAARRQRREGILYRIVSAILEMPEVRQRISKLSVEEYHRLDEFNENGRRTELIRGIVIEKMSKSPLHSSIGRKLYQRLLAMVTEGFVVCREDPLTLADSEPEPDISIVHGREADLQRAHASTAELVVEIAVSSPSLDRELAAAYAEAGIKEYWIILGAERKVEVYRQPVAGRYQELRVAGADEVLECGSVPGVRIVLDELFG